MAERAGRRALEGGPVATDEVLESLVVALGAGRGIVLDRAAEILVLLAPGSIGVSGRRAALRGPTPPAAAHVLERIADPQTPDALAKALKHDDARVRTESAATLAEIQTPRR